MGIRNWFDIAVSLATNRTPFQCLARYQRSLNPSMLNSEWTEEEDAQLFSAVAIFGESDWQSVATVLERRTGTQCSNRWKKSLCPEKKGSFTREEDERLTVAVMLFGRKWKQIAKFVPGRIQSQCRDRYLNSLDPSLKWGGWTKEEDSRLKAAIAKHGYCWSKVAEDLPPRTDSQCRKRWKVLCPDQVPLLQAARKMQKEALASNFVDRESERPALTLNDFLPLAMLDPPSDADYADLPRKRKRKSSNVPKKRRLKKLAKRARINPEEVQDIEYGDEVKTCSGDDVHMAKITEPHLEDEVPTNGQGDLSGHGEKLRDLNPIGNNSTKRGKTCKKHHGRKNSAKDSSEHHRSQGSSRESLLSSIKDGEVVGSSSARRSVSKKKGKNGGKPSRNIRGAESSENKLNKIKISKPGSLSACVESLESQDGDNITLACFLQDKSKKRKFKCTKNVSHASFSSRTVVVSESLLSQEQVENQIPSGVQDGLSQTCGTAGIEDLFMEQNVPIHGQLRKPDDATTLTENENDDGDMTLACFLGNQSKKRSQAAKGRCACSSSKLKKGSALLPEGRCADKPTITADDNGRSMSKLVEEQTVLHGGVSEPTNIDVENRDDLLASFMKNKKKRQRREPKSH